MRWEVLACLALVATLGQARLLSTAFGDGMVLQAYPQSAILYGYSAKSGSTITVTLDSGATTITAKSDSNGHWEAALPAQKAALETSHTIAVTSNNAGDAPVTLLRVLFGEVFLCSGQSNMAFQLSRVANADAEIAKAIGYSSLRLAHVPQARALTPQREPASPIEWNIPSSSAVASFSAICILYGEHMFDLLKVPIGLIDDSVGGTYIEQWTAKEFVDVCPCDVPPKTFNNSDLWNAMVAPFTGMRHKAQLWYQGEADVNNAECYGSCSFPAMINGWRHAWMRNGFIRTPGMPPTVVGHRGAASAAPENTIPSQEVCRRSGTQWIEDDTQPSKDKVPFVLHDPTVDRTTDGKGAIRDLTAAELKKLDAGIKFAPIFAGTRLPTLQDQLVDLRTRGGNLLMEIKGAHSRQEVATLAAVIRQEKMTERVLVHSFDVPSLQYMYEVAPELPLALLRSSLDADPVAISRQLHLTNYHPVSSIVTKSLVDSLHAVGVGVFAWTPDTAAEWKTLDAFGVDGIITNRPAELQGWISAMYPGVNAPTPVWHPPLDGAMTPFLFVQLAAYYPEPNLAAQRLAQARVLTMPNVGMATAVDLGMPSGDIHPTNKQDVASRLKLAAQHFVYGSDAVVYLGPEPAKVTVLAQPPTTKINIEYSAVSLGNGIDVRSEPDCPTNETQCGSTFEVQIDGRVWVRATFGKSDDKTVQLVAVATGSKVTGIRHLWGAWPLVAIYNSAKLPSAPFLISQL